MLLAGMTAAFLACGCAIFPEDETFGEPNVCEVHHVKMDKEEVPIVYGLLLRTERASAEDSVRMNLFPHPREFVEGGCTVETGSPKHAVIYVCKDCDRAKKQWESDYDSQHPDGNKHSSTQGR